MRLKATQNFASPASVLMVFFGLRGISGEDDSTLVNRKPPWNGTGRGTLDGYMNDKQIDAVARPSVHPLRRRQSVVSPAAGID
jgi:hypothetical protein